MSLTLATATRSAMADGLNGKITPNSTLEIHGGTRAATADTASTGANPVLATVALGATPFTEANGVLTLTADPAPVTASATGTASWFRIMAGGTTPVLDGKVTATGDSSGDLILATTAITSGLTVDITAAGTITMPAGTVS